MEADHLEQVWHEYSSRLLAFIRGKVGGRADAEDILQEVFLRVHTGLCCREAVGRLDRWIYRVARNLIIDHYRRRRPVGDISDTLPAGDDASFEEDPRARLAFSLRETIDELPSPYREALVATEYEGLSQQQFAERAGISLSGAKSRVQRAREKLRQLLLECCHFELDRSGRIVDYYERCCRCTAGRVC
jgi:RNA polymerase sigma-70 factor (ECF subfamily)